MSYAFRWLDQLHTILDTLFVLLLFVVLMSVIWVLFRNEDVFNDHEFSDHED